MNYDDAVVSDERKATVKYRMIKDWRKGKSSYLMFLPALITGKLRPNDYKLLISVLLSLILIAVMAGLISWQQESWVGITWVVPILHIMFTGGSVVRTLAVDSKINFLEASIFTLGYIIQFVWGFVDWYFRLNHHTVQGDPDALFLIWYAVGIPFATSLYVLAHKWIDMKGKMTKFVILLIVGLAIKLVLMIVLCYWLQGPISGSILLGVLIFIGFIAAQILIYIKIGYLPFLWKVIVVALIACICFIAYLVSWIIDYFIIFSVAWWIFIILIILFSGFNIFTDIRDIEKSPLYFSPWIFPIYKYDKKKDDI